MTYRFVPHRLRYLAQLATLLISAILGGSIMVAPPKADPKLTVIEKAMEADTWGYIMIAFGLVGFFTEMYSERRRQKAHLFWVVSGCHITLCAVLIGYTAAALAGMIDRGLWWNFGSPALGLYLAFIHYIYVQRQPKEPIPDVP